MHGHDMIAIGASAGGVEALTTLVGLLPAELPAALFVVLHVSANGPSLLPHLLNRHSHMLALHPTDRSRIQHGRIYVAPPDHHLMVDGQCVRVVRGPFENGHRPAIDLLFRSLARAYGPRVVGVVLSGAQDDGTAGLVAIKKQGGITVVQDPEEAAYSSMPASALAGAPIDHCLPLQGIARLFVELVRDPVPAMPHESVAMTREQLDTALELRMMARGEHPGEPSAYSCPECGGVLWEIEEEGILRFRCRVGHGFSVASILAEQMRAVERSLWTSLKTLEERASLLRRLHGQPRNLAPLLAAQSYAQELSDAEELATAVRNILNRESVARPLPDPDPPV